MTLVLRVRPATDTPFSFQSDSEFVIGRSQLADVSIPSDRFISKRHARVFEEHGEWFVEDLGSTNTTLLNGRAIEQPTPVSRGDVIRLSNCAIEIASTTGSDSYGTYCSATDVLKRTDSAELLDTDGDPGLRRYAERLAILNEVHKALAGQLSRDELLALILDRAYTHLQPEEGVILLESEDGCFDTVVSRRRKNLKGDYLYSRKLIHLVARRGMAALVHDVQDDERFAGATSLLNLGIRSVVAAPIHYAGGRPGMIALATRATVKNFTNEDMELLVSLASVAAVHLRTLDLHEDRARRKHLEKELKLAREIQVGLFPDALPELSGYALYASNIPSRTVSGDLYRIQERKEECVFVVADVAGKGMAASLLTASLEALSIGPIESGRTPDEICRRLSRRLHARTPPERFATAIIAVLRPDSGVVRYANAGHLAALVLRPNGTVDELPATGMPLGVMPDASYSCEEARLEPGATLVMYTDGITEAQDGTESQYDGWRLKRVCSEHHDGTVEALAEAIARDLGGFVKGTPYEDDRTLVIVHRKV